MQKFNDFVVERREIIEEGILDRAKARMSGVVSGAKQVVQNVKNNKAQNGSYFKGNIVGGTQQAYQSAKYSNVLQVYIKKIFSQAIQFQQFMDQNEAKMPTELATASAEKLNEVKKMLAAFARSKNAVLKAAMQGVNVNEIKTRKVPQQQNQQQQNNQNSGAVA